MDTGEAASLTGKTLQSLLPVGIRLGAETCLVSWTFSGPFGESWHFFGNATGSLDGTDCLFLDCSLH